MAGLDRIMFAQYRKPTSFSPSITVPMTGISIQVQRQLFQKLCRANIRCPFCTAGCATNSVTLANTYSQGVSFCPSLTVQTGNLLDPSDYSRLVKPVNIYRTAYQMGQTLEEFVRSTNEQYTKASLIQQEVASKENKDDFSANSVIKKGTL